MGYLDVHFVKNTIKSSGNLQNLKIFGKVRFFLTVYEETQKQFLNPTPTPKIAHQGPKKSKMTQKSSQYQKSEFKEL